MPLQSMNCVLVLAVTSCLFPAHAAVPASAPPEGQAEVVQIRWWENRFRRLGSGTTKEESIPEEMDVQFSTKQGEFHLVLKRNRLLLPAHVRHTLHYADGHTEDGPRPQPCFYQGELVGETKGVASISTCGGVFNGLLLTDTQAVVIESLPGRQLAGEEDQLRAPASEEHHRVRVLEDEDFKDFVGDIARFTSVSEATTPGGRSLSSTSTKYVEVVVVNDNSRYTSFGGNSGLTTLATHSASVMNTVTTIYNTAPKDAAVFPFKIQVVLVAMKTLVQGDPWESTVKMVGSETDCSSLLDLFNTWGNTQQSAGKLAAADNRVLLSGRDFDGNTVGLAGVSAMCDASRSGSVNMCKQGDDAAKCAGTVAHEMGHNFGMHHDGDANNDQNKGCGSSGLIMESVGDSTPSTQFSSCSVANIKTFFTTSYADNGACLDNMPTTVFGDPVCQNGFVEEGEDCDCGGADCSSVDPCCNGATCKFSDSAHECSDVTGPCCKSCKFVSASSNTVCRAARNDCDLAETCQGGTQSCPRDVFVYPGKACTVTSGGVNTAYKGLCAAGKCMSLSYTCAVETTRDFKGNWDLTDTCAAYNDDCGNLVCHDADQSTKPYECGQNFATHGKQMAVPEGTPCWFPGDPTGTRLGMCAGGGCKQDFALAVVPLCGNGGIDYGEQCDCGSDGNGDSCCECATCKLKSTSSCSALDDCCDSSTCKLKAAGAVCRAAISSCDLQEVCSGSSAICPTDIGKQWGTACTSDDSVATEAVSTCYGKKCMTSLSSQCSAVSENARTRATRSLTGDIPAADSHDCKALMCCTACTYNKGDYTCTVDGKDTPCTDPVMCQGCTARTSYKSFTVDGVTSTIYLGGALDGSVLAGKMCVGSEAITPASSCSSTEFLEVSVGRCLTCDSACTACSGPTNFDCTGACKHGTKDSRGACPISADQVSFAPTVSPTPASPTPASPTPSSPTPASPTPSSPTPASPTPATPGSNSTNKSNSTPGSNSTNTSNSTPATAPTTAVPKRTVTTKLLGSMNLKVADPAAFVNDTVATNAVAEAIAELAGVPKSYLVVVFSIITSRRLQSQPPRQLANTTSAVKVDYTITIPPGSTAAPSAVSSTLKNKGLTALSTAIQKKVSAVKPGLTIEVTSKSVPTMTETPASSSTATTGASTTGGTTTGGDTTAGAASGAAETVSVGSMLGPAASVFLFILSCSAH